MPKPKDPMSNALNSAMKARKGSTSSPSNGRPRSAPMLIPTNGILLGEAEVAVIEPDVREAFAKQMRKSISGARDLRDETTEAQDEG